MRKITTLLLALIAVVAYAGIPDGYYTNIDSKKYTALKSALNGIISSHKVLGYNSLWEYYPSTYYHLDDKKKVLDMYSNTARYYTGTSAVSGMNKEHTVPKSWWGGSTSAAPGNDLYNVIPSDADANSRKSNYSLGLVSKQSWTNGITTIGTGNVNGYSDTFFEPADEYKGDFARIYFYMAVCYPDIAWDTNNARAMTNKSDLTLQDWIIPMLIEWSAMDPVDASEIQRNEDVYAVQGNRNPFIDYPSLIDYIWGSKKAEAFILASHKPNEGTSTSIVAGIPLVSPAGGTEAQPASYSYGTKITITGSSSTSIIYTRVNGGEWKETKYTTGYNSTSQTEYHNPAVATYTLNEDMHIEAYSTMEGRENSDTVSYYYHPVNYSNDYLLYEDFSGVSGGNNTSTSGSSSAWDGDEMFPTTTKAYCAGEAIKLSTSSAAGSITSKKMDFVGGSVEVEIAVKGWSTVEAPLSVTITGVSTQSVSYTAKMSDKFETKKITIDNVSANPQLKISCAKRCFLKKVTVKAAGSTGIHSVVNTQEAENEVVYDIQGRRLRSFPKTPGLYIINGHKTIVR